MGPLTAALWKAHPASDWLKMAIPTLSYSAFL
jgi:hypothetical protein